MNILALHTGGHDATAAIFDEYDLVAAIQKERISRIKGDGGASPDLIDEALRISGLSHTDIDVLVVSNGLFPYHFLKLPLFRKLKYDLLAFFGKTTELNSQRFAFQAGKLQKLGAFFGLKNATQVFLCEHHYAHALSAFKHTDWTDQALLYTYDGTGDSVFHSAYYYDGKTLECLEGGAAEKFEKNVVGSLAFAYAFCTKAIGFRPNRHEGKLTGLAAYGQPSLYDVIAENFYVSEGGLIRSKFANKKAMRDFFMKISQGVKREDVACSIQKILEDFILKSVKIYVEKTGARKLGVAGGVFANVRLNKHLKDHLDLDEIFIFPGMGDEGVAVGGALQFLLERDGLEKFVTHKSKLQDVYLGYDYDKEVDTVFTKSDAIELVEGEPAVKCAELLASGKVGAIYTGRMEYGPRALGARTIMASPVDNGVNDSINKRLNRTEFMPFAPYVLAEDARDVFEIDDVNEYACNFMTITTDVKEEWKHKIPAVVHVDGTARPQIITREQNPLYYDILKNFKEQTGIAALVNTSFNAHEEPIINTPQECLRALVNDRVDFVVTQKAIYQKKA